MNIGLALKKSYTFHELEDMKSRTCENNYSRWLFLKALHRRCLTSFWVYLRFWISQGSEKPRILNMPLVLNVPRFWICQGSKYGPGFEYARILNIPEFWICQGYTVFRISMNNSWICLNMPDYVYIYLNIPECARIHGWGPRILIHPSSVLFFQNF